MSARGLQALLDGFAADVSGPRRRKTPLRYAEPSSPSPERQSKQSRRASAGARSAAPKQPQKRMRCGECNSCRASNCGKCKFCIDMPKFGGSGTLRQPCINRLCEVLLSAHREAKEAAAAVREEEREKRRAEKEAERAERDARRMERDEIRRKERAERAAARGLRRQAMAAKVGQPNGGWGEHNDLNVGSAVEVRLTEDGLDGSIYSGTLAQYAKDELGVDGCWVVFDELLEEESESELLREWVRREDVRPKPPPTPDGFAHLIQTGDIIELNFEDGWWEVEVEKVEVHVVDEAVPTEGETTQRAEEEARVGISKRDKMDNIHPISMRQESPDGLTPGDTNTEAGTVGVDGAPEAGGADVSRLHTETAMGAMAHGENMTSDGSSGQERGAFIVTEDAAAMGCVKNTSRSVASQDDVVHIDAGVHASPTVTNEGVAMGSLTQKSPSQGEETVLGSLTFHVRSVKYNALHRVDASRLRPLWMWSSHEPLWRFEIEAGHGFAVSTLQPVKDNASNSIGAVPSSCTTRVAENGVATLFRFARGMPRSHNTPGSHSRIGCIYDALDQL
eukprot:scaffold95587_cov30-Tisochrysis_lutea.AAC.1